MDFLFTQGRNPWVFLDKEATKVGAIFERDFEHGEAFTAFDEKTLAAGLVEYENPEKTLATRDQDPGAVTQTVTGDPPQSRN